MSLPDQTPKLPKYPFLLADAALLGAAVFIATRSAGPLSTESIIAIVGCVAVGGLLAAVPFLADYARKQDEALDERQRGLDALSRTVHEAAEQIGIAASGLHQIAELAQRNLKTAEHLPQKLHEQIAGFQAQLDNAREDDREQLEKELEELRAAEGDRLEASAEKIAKAIADLTKLESTIQKHLAAAQDAAAQPPTQIVTAIENAANAAAERLAKLPAGDIDAAEARLKQAQDRALAAIDAALAAGTASAVATIEAALSKLSVAVPTNASAPVPISSEATSEPTATSSESTSQQAEPPTPKRRNRARREEPPAAPEPTAATTSPVEPEPETTPTETAPDETPTAAATPEPTPEPTAEPIPAEAATHEPVEAPAETAATPADEPAVSSESSVPVEEPVANPELPPADEIPASAKETPATEAPADEAPSATAVEADPAPTPEPEPGPTPAPEPAAQESEPPAEPAPKSRKRAPKPSSDLTMELPADDFSQTALEEAAAPTERVISSDGATRLLVTAYIGIGNRLFIRGEGPGLSEEKGVPLQFVSIGKWRWETTDATAPIRVRLLKNDSIECPNLGELTIDPGHQAEVNAKF